MAERSKKSSRSQQSYKKSRLGRRPHPFCDTSAAHVVVRAAEQLDWQLDDPKAFLRRVQHVEYGLSSEMEFAALLRWLGRCPMVHRLSEDVLADTEVPWSVPDLITVFSLAGSIFPALIEVKTTKRPILKVKKTYLSRLQAYAKLLHLPLLIAWRPRSIGFWVMVDPIQISPVDANTLSLNLNDALRNDLMSLVAGDFYIVPEQGVGLRIEAMRISAKIPTDDGYEAKYRINKACILDSDRNEVNKVPNSIIWMIFSAMHYHQEVTDKAIVQSFLTHGGMIRAQMVLRTAGSFPLEEGQRIHWKEVGTNLDAIISSSSLLSDAQNHFGTFVQYIFHQQPQAVPGFLPDNWGTGVR